MNGYEFFTRQNERNYAAVRHNTHAPFSIYTNGEYVGEARNRDAALAIIASHSTQVPGQATLF